MIDRSSIVLNIPVVEITLSVVSGDDRFCIICESYQPAFFGANSGIKLRARLYSNWHRLLGLVHKAVASLHCLTIHSPHVIRNLVCSYHDYKYSVVMFSTVKSEIRHKLE